jgi:hypothetical protein
LRGGIFGPCWLVVMRISATIRSIIDNIALTVHGRFRLYHPPRPLTDIPVEDDFIYEDEEEDEPDIDVENGYYNAKGSAPHREINRQH